MMYEDIEDALNAVEILYNNLKAHMSRDNPMFDLECSTIINTLETLDEYKKFKDVVCDSCVDLYAIKYCENLEDYNVWVLKSRGCYYKLNQEQFDLLKGIMNNYDE